jgi:hypothetical protein
MSLVYTGSGAHGGFGSHSLNRPLQIQFMYICELYAPL